MVSALRDVPDVIPSFANVVRTIINGMPMTSGWFTWILSKNMLKTEITGLTHREYGYVMMGLVILVQIPRTAIWLRTIDKQDQKKNFHNFIKRRSMIEVDNNNRASIDSNGNTPRVSVVRRASVQMMSSITDLRGT